CFNMKTSMNDESISSRISSGDKSKINETIDSTLKWMDSNQLAEKDEYEHKLKEVEKICSPIMTKLHGENNTSNGQSAPNAGGKGPTIEEVD
ncbi:unnamed protein product, partial [Adineta steineri]